MRKGTSLSKKLSAVLLTAMLVLNFAPINILPAATAAGAGEASSALPFRNLTVAEITHEMGAGINLGNTFEGHTDFEPSETLWQSTYTTRMYIDAVHNAGFNTIRIPVTWGTMIDDETYVIKDEWISRVQDVVDYAIDQDMYVIINLHHDGAEQTGWLRVESDDPAGVLKKFSGVWTTIAAYFKDYDEHLIFESMNEVWGSTQTIHEDYQVINNLNQAFVDAVRATGSNNAYRWLSVPGRYTNIASTTTASYGFQLPTDSIDNRLFVSVHDYPISLGLTNTMSTTTYSEATAKAYGPSFQKLIDSFTSKGIPVILGEYGVMNKNNTVEREYYYESVTQFCATAGVVACAWEIGEYDLTADPADYCMVFLDRKTGEPVYPTLISAILRGTFSDIDTLTLDNIKKPTETSPTAIKEITDITFNSSSLTMEVGDIAQIKTTLRPSDTNDILLWSSEDTAVATVYNGKVIARGIGSTTLHVYSDSGSIKKTLSVTVDADSSAAKCEEITVADSVTLRTGEYVRLGAVNATKGSDAFLTYKSDNPSVATVSRIGKIVGISEGTCTVTVTASTGYTKKVNVTVEKLDVTSDITLGLHIYFSSEQYIGDESGDTLTVNGDGTFTLSFDCSKHLSEKALAAGVTGLDGFGAIYIKDEARGYVLDSCNILYNEIKVDNTPLTITQTEKKSALKNGVLDTNDPINAWDGSLVQEVEANDFAISFTGVTKPQIISVTFTISDLQFTGANAPAGPDTLNSSEEAVDPYSGVGTYMAFIQIQTTSWVYRNNFDKTTYGTDIFNTVYNNETSAPTSTVISDAVIDGDGEYTISLQDLSLEGSTDFNMVAISTNIPLDTGIAITEATLKYDSKTITSSFVQKNDSKEFIHLMFINQYDNAMKDTVNTMVPADGSDMIITFKVTGFGYDKAVQEEPDSDNPAESATGTYTVPVTSEEISDDAKNSKDSGLPVGAIIGIIAGIAVAGGIIAYVLLKKKA